MKKTGQANIRIPDEAKGLISRIARRLREDRGFFYRLRKFMDEEENVGVSALLSDRVAHLESVLARVMTDLAPDAVDDIERLTRRSAMLPEPIKSTPIDASPVRWVVGDGKGRRLTPEGETELLRLASEGMEPGEIAKRLDVKLYAVTRRLRAHVGT